MAIAGDAARLGLQALPALRGRLRLRRHLSRSSRPLQLPELRPATAPSPRSRPSRSSSTGTRGASFGLRTPARLRDAYESPLPGLYNVYNALGAATLCLELGVSLEVVVAGLESRHGRLRPRRADRGRRRRALDPAGQEPGRCQRDPAHARARARDARPARGPERQHRRRPRHLVGLGRRLRDPHATRAPRHLLGHPRRRARPAAQVRRHRRRSGSRSSPTSRPPWIARSRPRRLRTRSCSRCRPTPRCWPCAKSSPSAATSSASGRTCFRP